MIKIQKKNFSLSEVNKKLLKKNSGAIVTFIGIVRGEKKTKKIQSIYIECYLKMAEKELKKVFPNLELQELPADHPLFSSAFNFPEGLPKIHEHDGKRPQAFGITYQNRLVLLFTFESDLGDGWENQEVHNDPQQVREKALKMGANIVKYAFEN